MSRLIPNSAKALIIRNGKMLTIRLQENGDSRYIMPGGEQGTGEQFPETICRKVAEELEVRVPPGELAFVAESVHGEAFTGVTLCAASIRYQSARL